MTSFQTKKLFLFALISLSSAFVIYAILASTIDDPMLLAKMKQGLFGLAALLVFVDWIFEIFSWRQHRENSHYEIQKITTDFGRKQEMATNERDRLATVFHTMQEGVVVLNEVGEITLFNPAMAKILSFNEEDLGCSLLEIIRNADLQLLVERALRGEERVAEELRMFLGEERYFQTQATPLRNHDEITGIVLVIYEITQLRQLERARRDFVANVSHELKTPLTSIQGFVETLIDSDLKDKEQTRKFLGILETNTRRLNRLVKELLRLSQIEAQQYILHPEAIKILDLFEELKKLHQAAADKKEMMVETKIIPAEALVDADKNALLQILSNLLDNAIKYSPKKSKISLSYRLGELGGEFTVTDQGIGIPQANLHRVFERFYRVDRSRSREEGGTGLGLAIAKHLIQLLEGEIWVESEEGKGSRFVFRLPSHP